MADYIPAPYKCSAGDGGWYVWDFSPAQPDGSCPGAMYVVLNGADYVYLHQLVVDAQNNKTNPFDLSVEDAAAIGSAILLTWAIAFGLRAMRNFLSDWSNTNE